MILFEKLGQHQPLNRPAERYAKEGVEISLSRLADQVGACAAALEPIHALITAHGLGAERLHGLSRQIWLCQIASRAMDGTTVPLLAKGGTQPARLWTYVRDDRSFGGDSPPAALFHVSRDRGMTNPNRHLAGWQGILQVDAYRGYNDLYRADRDRRPVESALCWFHARHKLADIKGNAGKGKPAHDISFVALDAVARIDAVFDIERRINGLTAAERQATRHQLSRPLIEELDDWPSAERNRVSKHNPVVKAIGYMFKAVRWSAFTRFLDDGRVCLTDNAAVRALRGVALGRKSWLFAGSERGGDRAAFMYSLIVTAKMKDIDPQAWLGDVLARLPGTTASRVPDLLP